MFRMKKIINVSLIFIKFLFLLTSFVLTFNIVLRMYERLGKNYIESIPVFIPYIILFFLFSINFILRQKRVNNSMFYNITCCLVFAMLIFCGYRAMTDKYMLLYIRLGDYHINFNYYADIIAPMKVMLYLLSVSNILLMFIGKNDIKENE